MMWQFVMTGWNDGIVMMVMMVVMMTIIPWLCAMIVRTPQLSGAEALPIDSTYFGKCGRNGRSK